MARIPIDIGVLGNPATGDTLRTAMNKINTNFIEVYDDLAGASLGGLFTNNATNGDVKIQANGTGIVEVDQLQINGDNITSLITNGDLTLSGNGTGGVEVLGALTATSLTTNTITSNGSNADLSIQASGTGNIDIAALTFNGTSITSSDSSRINLNENVTVDGDLLVTGTITGTISAVDADSSTVSNLEVDNFKASAIVIESEGITNNDNDTTLPTSAAVKDYVDNNASPANVGDIVFNGSTISAPSDADLTLTTSGTGSVSVEAIQIKGTELSSTDSTQITIKENLHVTGNISGGTFSGVTLFSVANADSTTTNPTNGTLTLKADRGIVVQQYGDGTLLIDGAPLQARVGSLESTSITASSTDTLTNKTIDANGTGNSISNLEVADFAAAAIVTEGDGIGANDNDTTIPTSAAVKDYVDARDIGDLSVTGSTISAPSNADLTLTTSGTGNVVASGSTVTADEFIGEMNGAMVFDARNTSGGTISKGEAVYISGLSGNTPTIAKARANSASTMPAFGIAVADISDSTTGQVATFGSLKGLDVSDFGETSITFALGNTIYVSSAEAGKLTNVAPTGESNLIQNIGKIERATPTTNMTIKVGGAGRSNATPALDDGNIFIGNGSNQSSTVSLATQIKSYTGLTVVGDDSSGTGFNIGESIKVAGATGVTTAVSGDTLTITGPDLSSYLQNTGTQTIDNLSFNDNIISTSSNADLNLDPGGTGNVKILTDQITLGTGSSAGTEAVAIGKNTNAGNYAQAIGNNAGNSGQGQGAVALGSEAGETNQGSKAVAIGNYAGETTQGANAIAIGEGAGKTNQAANSIVINASGSDLNNTTASSLVVKPIRNASGTHQLEYNPTTGEVTYDTLASGGATGDLTITGSTISSPSNADLTLTTSGAGSVTVTGGDLVTADISSSGDIDAVGFTATGSSTFDGVQITDNKVTSASSNADLELDAAGTGGIVAQSPFTFNAGYIEKINTLTSSSTITVNCALASIHTVTLGTSTEFNITNLPTGGSVTLIITQDGSGNRTATFGTDGSSAVKFPSNSSTLSTGAGDIDVVTIVNDGTNFLGNIAKDYRSS